MALGMALAIFGLAACDLHPLPIDLLTGEGGHPATSTSTSSGVGQGGQGGEGGSDWGENQLPCEVRSVLESVCVSCHSSPPSAGAPMALTSRYDFLTHWQDTGQTVGERSVDRMKHGGAPMPPSSEPPPAPEALTVIEQWVSAGMPAGSCGSLPEKPLDTSCASGDYWADGDTGSAKMNPGLACRACHKVNASDKNYFFMGTVFPSFHEEDLCNSPPPPDARLEIIDVSGAVALTLTPNSVGNFQSSAVVAGVSVPYTARLVANGLTRAMSTPQMDGDCNKCHTEQGAEEAPGRLVWPGTWEPPTVLAPTMVSVEPMAGALHVVFQGTACDKILLSRNQDGGDYVVAYSVSGSTKFVHDEDASNVGSLYCYKAQCKKGVDVSDYSNELCNTP